MEIWKDIIGYEGYYQVSNQGRIKGLKRKVLAKNNSTRIISEKIFNPSINGHGYLFFLLRKSQYYRVGSVHRLVAEHFIPNPENKEQVNHINGIKTDNRVENLEWCTRSENAIHSFKIGLQCNKGINHPGNILTENDVNEIRSSYLPKIFTTTMLANKYRVSKQTIKDVIKRNTWKHI